MDPLRKLARRAKDNRGKLFRTFHKQSPVHTQSEGEDSINRGDIKLQYKRSTCDSEASVAESAIDVQQCSRSYDMDDCPLLERRYPGLEPFMEIEGLQEYVIPLTLHAVKYDWSQVKGWDVAQLEENIRHMEFLGDDANMCAATLARAEGEMLCWLQNCSDHLHDIYHMLEFLAGKTAIIRGIAVNGLTFMSFEEDSLRGEDLPELPAKLLCRLIQVLFEQLLCFFPVSEGGCRVLTKFIVYADMEGTVWAFSRD